MHTRPTFPLRAMHLPFYYHCEIWVFLDQWLFLCTCLFDVLWQWNSTLLFKPVLFKAINYHVIITRACSFGLTACALLLYGLYTNYVVTLSRYWDRWSEVLLGLQRDPWEKMESRRSRDYKGYGNTPLACGSWRWMLKHGEKQSMIHLFLCKEIHSLSLRCSGHGEQWAEETVPCATWKSLKEL